MDNFLKDLASPYWWISVIFIGFLINVVAAFLKDRIEKSLGNYSKKRKTRLELQKKEEMEEIDLISRSNMAIIEYFFEYIHRSMVGIRFFFLGVLGLLINNQFISLNSLSLSEITFMVIILIFSFLAYLLGLVLPRRQEYILSTALKNRKNKEL